ncbi:guanine exchange factor for Rac 30-like [Schistocerca gregaria]|uniref:guanine exchange factor for Rac 30-like n=1 Tax=Schistocerca gregaria TaxID=7010 RepID=UPI00211E2903|nr:guanine exchange factor for Rac 30-like [Schistocerca gregaria]
MAVNAGLYSRNIGDWLELQNQSFLAWVNHYLEPAGMSISDFTTDLSDGIRLIVLLEILTGTKFAKYVKNPRFPAQKLANISEALEFMAKKFGIKFIGCNSQDIMEGKRNQCMGVIFLLINKFKSYSLSAQTGPGEADEKLAPLPDVMVPVVERVEGERAAPLEGERARPGQPEAAPRPPVPPKQRSAPQELGEKRISAIVREKLVVRLQAYFLGYRERSRYRALLRETTKVMRAFEEGDAEREWLVALQAAVRLYAVKSMPSIRAKRRRNEIAKEILTTESTYVQSLRALVDVYMRRLEELGESVVSMPKLRTIFSEVKVILSYNEVILGKLHDRMENWYSSGQQLGDIFIYLTDFLKVYTAYVNNYDESISVLQDVSCNPQVSEVLKSCREDPRVRGMELSSYLIMPIQRIPRYVLLLSDLFKNTPENHPDYPNLMNAQKKMENVARYVNQKKREAENLLGVATILRHLTDLENANEFNQPHRRYVRFGQLFEVEPGSVIQQKSLRTRYFFLFNDLLLCSKEQTGVLGKKRGLALSDIDSLRNSDVQFRCLYVIELMDLIINEIPEVNKVKNIFELVMPSGKKITLATPTSKLKDEWVGDLDEMIMKCLENHRSRVEIPLEEEQACEKNFSHDASLRIPTFTGPLFKRNLAGHWKKKHFVLIGDILYYYDNILSSMNDSSEPKGKIYLLFTSVTFLSVMDRHFCFRLCLKSKVYYLSADSAHARLQWINMIRSSISKHLNQIELNQRPADSVRPVSTSAPPPPSAIPVGNLKRVKNIGDKRRSMESPDVASAVPPKLPLSEISQRASRSQTLCTPRGADDKQSRPASTKQHSKRRRKKFRETVCELRTGELYKYSYGSTKITKYRMTLTQKSILYYRGNRKKPAGMIDLLLVRSQPQKRAVPVTIDDLSLYEFTLLTSDRNVVLASECEKEANGWLEDISNALSNLF